MSNVLLYDFHGLFSSCRLILGSIDCFHAVLLKELGYVMELFCGRV